MCFILRLIVRNELHTCSSICLRVLCLHSLNLTSETLRSNEIEFLNQIFVIVKLITVWNFIGEQKKEELMFYFLI